MLGLVGLVFVVVGLIHLYLWKRLVRDPFGKGRASRVGGIAAVVLGLLIPATLIGVRGGYAKWLAWPGYVWLALMFYLLVVLAVLEIPRLVANLWLRAREKRGTASSAAAGAAPSPAQVAAGDGDGGAGAAELNAPRSIVPPNPASFSRSAGEPGAICSMRCRCVSMRCSRRTGSFLRNSCTRLPMTSSPFRPTRRK